MKEARENVTLRLLRDELGNVQQLGRASALRTGDLWLEESRVDLTQRALDRPMARRSRVPVNEPGKLETGYRRSRHRTWRSVARP